MIFPARSLYLFSSGIFSSKSHLITGGYHHQWISTVYPGIIIYVLVLDVNGIHQCINLFLYPIGYFDLPVVVSHQTYQTGCSWLMYIQHILEEPPIDWYTSTDPQTLHVACAFIDAYVGYLRSKCWYSLVISRMASWTIHHFLFQRTKPPFIGDFLASHDWIGKGTIQIIRNISVSVYLHYLQLS